MSLFNPFKVVSSFTNSLQPQLFFLGTEPFLCCSIGNTIVSYTCRKLRIAFKSQPYDYTIACFCAGEENCHDLTYSSPGKNFVEARKKNTPIWKTAIKSSNINSLAITNNYLICFCSDSIYTLDALTGQIVTEIVEMSTFGKLQHRLNYDFFDFEYGSLNSLLLASADLMIRQINYKTGEINNVFSCVSNFILSNYNTDLTMQFDSAQGKHIYVSSIVYCGLSSNVFAASVICKNEKDMINCILICDVLTDKVLFSYKLDISLGFIETLAFKPCKIHENRKPIEGDLSTVSLLLIGTNLGHLIVYDLDALSILTIEKGLHEVSKSAKAKTVTYIALLDNDYTRGVTILTSGSDNSIKCWNLKNYNSTFTQTTSRIGFTGMINNIIYDEATNDFYSKAIVDTYNSRDDLCCLGTVSLTNDCHSTIFSFEKGRKSYERANNLRLRITKVRAIASCLKRIYDWPSIISCHNNLHQVLLWSAEHSSFTGLTLELRKVRKTRTSIANSLTENISLLSDLLNSNTFYHRSFATAVAITPCGNFALVGYANSTVAVFNLQSRRHIGLCLGRHNAELEHLLKKKKKLTVISQELLSTSDPSQTLKKRLLFNSKLKMFLEEANKFTYDLLNNLTDDSRSITGLHILNGNLVLVIYKDCFKINIFNYRNQTLVKQCDLNSLIQENNIDSFSSNVNSVLTITTSLIVKNSLIVSLYNKNNDCSIILIIDLNGFNLVRSLKVKVGYCVKISVSPDLVLLTCLVKSNDDPDSKLSTLTFNISEALLLDWSAYDLMLKSFTYSHDSSIIISGFDTYNNGIRNSLPDFYGDSIFMLWTNSFHYYPMKIINQYTYKTPKRYDVNFTAIIDEATDDECVNQTQLPPIDFSQQTSNQGCLTISNKWSLMRLHQLISWENYKKESEAISLNKKTDDEPFFLFDEHSVDIFDTVSKDSQQIDNDSKAGPIPITKLLDDHDYEQLYSLLINGPISAIHLSLLSLIRIESIAKFVDFLYELILKGNEIDFVQTITYLFLKYTKSTIIDVMYPADVNIAALSDDFDLSTFIKALQSISDVSNKQQLSLNNSLSAIICDLKYNLLKQKSILY